VLQSPNAKGWQTKRFCQYPQIIIYELVEPTVVKQISILSHQSKIATKIVIHSKVDPKKEWSRLGFLSLESNVNSKFEARELKTVNVHDVASLYLRFSFEVNYVNSHNVFNQVGVISLCVFGDKLLGSEEPDRPGMPTISELDRNTVAKIKTL
jgi:centrosomal protein CEP104